MSKPVLSDLFTFSGRRNRKSYVMFHLAMIGIAFAAIVVGTLLTALAPILGGIFMFVAVVFFTVMTVSGFAVTAQRIRDIGYSGCWVFLYLIPYVGFAASIALYFVPSNPGENKYGPSCIE